MPFLVIIYTVAICYMLLDGIPIESQHRNASEFFAAPFHKERRRPAYKAHGF